MKLHKYLMLLLPAAMTFAACSDDLTGTDWQPGEPSEAPGVYFAPDNETFMALLDGDGSVASLKVCRIDNKGSLSVPVVVKNADSQMVIPSAVTFADGEYETTLDVDCAASPAITSLPLELTFPNEFINPYSAGAAEYSGSVIVSRWENVSETGVTEMKVVSWGYADIGFEPIPSQMYHLLGSNRYRILNFMGSDIDFTFELVQSPLKSTYYRIVPIANQLLLSDYGWGDYSYYNAWWLVYDNFDDEDEDDESSGWPEIELKYTNGNTLLIYYLQFLWYDDATNTEYCYVTNYDKGKPTAYMAFYGNLDEDMERYTTYYRLSFSWKEDRGE